jgi:hypothetical protein
MFTDGLEKYACGNLFLFNVQEVIMLHVAELL